MKRFGFILIASFLMWFFCFAEGVAFYSGEKEGWWWYQDFKKEEKKEEKKKQEKVVNKESKEKKKEEQKTEEKEITEWKPKKPLSEYTYEELLKMHPKEFSKMLEYYKDRAIQDPTNETAVYEYYNLLDVARKKSLLFMAQTMNVMNKYPELNVRKDVPTINPAIRKSYELQREEEKKTLAKLNQDIGLILFVKEGCPYCEVQLEIMKYFISQGIPVKVVNVAYDRGAISRFGIETVPTIILVHRETGAYYPIAVGVTSVAELEARIATLYKALKGEKDVLQGYLYEYQEGTSLDPYTPPPMFKNKTKKK